MDFHTEENRKKDTGTRVLAMVSVPVQTWETPTTPETALNQGTIFPGLNLPFYGADDLIGGVMR